MFVGESSHEFDDKTRKTKSISDKLFFMTNHNQLTKFIAQSCQAVNDRGNNPGEKTQDVEHSVRVTVAVCLWSCH